MQTSIFIAKLLGVIYVVFGLGVIFNSKFYRKLLEGMFKERSSLYFGGVMALVVGFLLVYYHNIWEMSWVVVITIIGWAGLLKGALLLMAPDAMVRWTKAWTKGKEFMPFWGAVMLLIGILFSYFGFFAA